MTSVINPAEPTPWAGAPGPGHSDHLTGPAGAPSAHPPGTYPPGTYPAGTYPAGTYPSVAYPSVAYPPGTYPPETYLAQPLPPPGRFTGFVTRLWDRSPRWLAPAAILTCFAGAAGYVLVSDPTDGAADAVPTCIVKLTTGFDCPGCGGTRAFYYLLQGNLPAASRHHMLFVFALPFLIYMYAAWAGQQVFRRSLPALRLPPATVGIFLAAWFAFTILRNLPWAPFTWLYV